MKMLCGFFLLLFTMNLQVNCADVSIYGSPESVNAKGTVTSVTDNSSSTQLISEASESEANQPVVTPVPEKAKEFPPGGFYVVLRSYFPKIPDLSKTVVQPTKEGEEARPMKPSEWLATQSVEALEWVPSDKPMFVYFPKEWDNPLNDKSKLTKGLKVSAPATMEFTNKEGVSAKITGAILYQVEGTFDTQEELIQAFPQPTPEGQPATVPNIELVDATTGIFGTNEANDVGSFVTSIGPLEADWSKEHITLAKQFIHDLLEKLGCFIATVVFETPDAPQLNVLREFRDKILMTSPEGALLVGYYYQHGPYWARDLRHHPVIKAMLRPIFVSAAFVLENLNLENPTTKAVFHELVDWVEWCASPLIENEQPPTLLDPTNPNP